ncbi:hypothetical protein PLANPX_4840 [Lacipirellula parvula]|uniref:Uncharacterized protein n=1 Tax=Lacipirellula parvula TaxID=2650471 RepID=A0A5K7XFE2_9BACT|nr:hypothetical protein PLANPX_4840 [Lacipirellula parvula]
MEEESRARRDLILAQGKLQEERNRLLENWSELELSRQAAIERQRRWAATETVGASLAAALTALLALGICWRVMAGQGSSAIDVEAACWLFEHEASCDARTRRLASNTSIDTPDLTTISGELS